MNKKSIFILLFVLSGLVVKAQTQTQTQIWDNNILTLLKESGAESYAMYGHDGLAWTTPINNVTADEIKTIVAGFLDIHPLRGNGIFIASEKFTPNQATDQSIKGKNGQRGFIACKTAQTVILAVYSEDKTSAKIVHEAVEEQAKYIKNLGY